jgi:P27 family predicted phage terminase small subunit
MIRQLNDGAMNQSVIPSMLIDNLQAVGIVTADCIDGDQGGQNSQYITTRHRESQPHLHDREINEKAKRRIWTMSRYKKPALGNSLQPPRSKVYRCPSWLSNEAKELWRDLAPRLLKLGVLTALDRAAFTALCVTYGRMWQIEREFAKADALVSDGRGGLKKNPLESSYKGICEMFRKLAGDFGLTPVSRGRISIDAEQDDNLDDLLNQNITKIR